MTASVKPPPKFAKRTLSPQQKQKHNFAFGQAGEDRAAQFLKAKHFQILDQNVRIGHTELDLVAIDPATNELVFVEVKTRTSDYAGHPSQAVNRLKMRSLAKCAKQYCTIKKLSLDYRFDVITILPGALEHFENVSW